MDEIESFKGTIVRQLYPGTKTLSFQSNIFRIVHVLPSGEDLKRHPNQPVPWKVKGDIPDWDPADLFEIHGAWETDPKHGVQFKAMQVVKLIPTTLAGKQAFLARNVKGVGPMRAKLICDYFGNDVIDVLDNRPERLKEVPKLSEKLAEKIAIEWHLEHDALQRQVGLWLAQYGISDAWAKRFIKTFGAKCIDLLTKNPYRATKVDGVGFRRADDIARRMGWPEQCAERTEAAFRFVVQESQQAGHVFVYHPDLIAQVRKIAASRKGEIKEEKQLPLEEAEIALQAVLDRGELVKETVKINGQTFFFYYLPQLLAAEKRLANRIAELQTLVHVKPKDIEDILDRVQDEDINCELDATQRDGVVKAFLNNVFVLTGGPGTGKTTTTEAILKTAERLGMAVCCAAPTGRAAKRMAEVTGYEAQTIHRLLGWSPDVGGFTRNHGNPFDCDLLLVDEFSMCDLELADALFDAVPDSCSVVLVGDVDQLPAVGPGMVLRDLITSGRIAVTKLEKIFRQAEGSLIIRNAHRIRKGEMPTFPDVKKGKGIESDSYFMEIPRVTREGKSGDDIEWVKKKLPAVIKRIVAKVDVDPIRDIQVLAPMKKNVAGTPVFNEVLQAALNPTGTEITVRGQKFRVGDRVMQLVNNYHDWADISNGDIGFIKAFDTEAEEIIIDFYGRDVRYPFKEVDDLVLAYACTIHKAQGSEHRVVIILLSGSYHHIMLERNLLYTALTRAKQMVVFLASWWAVKKAVETNNVTQRNTFLAHRIRKLVPGEESAPTPTPTPTPASTSDEWDEPYAMNQ